MSKLLHWLATNPIGGIVKVAVVGLLTYAANNVGGYVPVEYVPIITAVLTVALNALNPADARYGKKKATTA